MAKPNGARNLPLATLLRPASLAEVLGQPHLIGPRGALRGMVENGHLPSLILRGPPGVGKTTIARLLAAEAGKEFVQLSGASEGVPALRSALRTIEAKLTQGTPHVLFIDECHRWNRAQQDIFLPLVEEGKITLIGATTENPSYEVNAALLSRCRTFGLRPLGRMDLERLIDRANAVLDPALELNPDARALLCDAAGGDGRHLLNTIEDIAALAPAGPLSADAIRDLLSQSMPSFDKGGTMYNLLLSGLHKSIRGSDPDAALYWIARLVDAGAPLQVIARRLVAVALEDIGLADPEGLRHAMVARDAVEFLGPAGELALAHCAVILSSAPKSTAIADALAVAHTLSAESGRLLPKYPRPASDATLASDHFPEGLPRQTLYAPAEIGYERELIRRLSYWNRNRVK